MEKIETKPENNSNFDFKDKKNEVVRPLSSISSSVRSRLLPSSSSPVLSKLVDPTSTDIPKADAIVDNVNEKKLRAEEDRDLNLIRERLRDFLQAILKVVKEDSKVV